MVVAGIMSGTSLDGLDIAVCRFNSKSSYEVLETQTFSYPAELKAKLSKTDINALDFNILHNQFGNLIGKKIKSLNSYQSGVINLISTHGHTFFHQPQIKLTVQIGNGANIYASTGIKTVSDFRTVDVALNGNGAPLVPIGEKFLFPETKCFLNLGGICNISIHKPHQILGFDIVPFNILFNHFASLLNYPYDEGGEIAGFGTVNEELLQELNKFPYLKESYPKSLDKDTCLNYFLNIPLIRSTPIGNVMRTLVEFYANCISLVIKEFRIKEILITGGGAYHKVFIEELKKKNTETTITLPVPEIIEFKEAIIFAYLGYLKLNQENNILSSVTGSLEDHIGGSLWG